MAQPKTQSENFTKEKALIKHLLKGAAILEDIYNQLLRQRELLVQFEDCNELDVDRCIKMMNTWGWPTNGKPQLWTSDPLVGSVQLDGVWRHVKSFKDERRGRGIEGAGHRRGAVVGADHVALHEAHDPAGGGARISGDDPPAQRSRGEARRGGNARKGPQRGRQLT